MSGTLNEYGASVPEARKNALQRPLAKQRLPPQLVGVPTKLSDYDQREGDIKVFIGSLVNHGMTTLSEGGDLTPEVAREVLVTVL